jgi:heparan-alpha-glucosaminide N-acetyltransferase
MFLLLAEVLRSCDVSSALPFSRAWRFVCQQQTHAAWVGASLHDLIQPSFYFLVGLGLLLSMERRRRAGQSFWQMARHTAIRSSIFIVLGLVLVAVHPRQWTWVFTDTLTQIGLAYPFVFLVALLPRRDWFLALGILLIGYWLWFALVPIPTDFDYASAGVSSEWLRAHGLTGFAAHWQKNSNPSWAFDRWFLNLFPADVAYTGSETGLTTLNFVPSIGSMILGLIAADILVSQRPPERKWLRLCAFGLILIGSGWMLGFLGVVPVVKPIWTPSWVLFSGGWCYLLLAGFYGLVDIGKLGWMAFPLVVIGMNSMIAYCMSHLYPAFAFGSLRRLVGSRVFTAFGDAYEPFVYGCAVLAMYWLILYMLYRQKIFVRM